MHFIKTDLSSRKCGQLNSKNKNVLWNEGFSGNYDKDSKLKLAGSIDDLR